MGEIHKRKNIKGSLEFPFLTEKVKFEVGTYSEGEIVEWDSVGLVVKKCTDPTKIFGVVTDDITIDVSTTQGTVYVTGVFNLNGIVKSDSVAVAALKENGRKLSLFFK